jgi:hypothetical protein
LASGEALKKRYKIIDEETGEEVQGYVLRPSEDAFAQSAMFAYSALCGIPDEAGAAMYVAMNNPPSNDDRELLDTIVEANWNPAEVSDTFDADQIEHLSTANYGDGSVAAAFLLFRSLGCEPVKLICRSHKDEEAMKQAKAEREKLKEIHNYQARLTGGFGG